MDQPRKKPISRFLSWYGSGRSLPRALTRPDTASSAVSLSLASPHVSDDEKGLLGLTTLYEPQIPTSPVADIVFIHGLGGGSRKTWSFSPEPCHHWPRYWLPADNDFADVRIHTFGYKADWGELRQGVLNVNDLAKSLLGAIRNHPGICQTNTRIVLVGHCMGGSVAKVTYILARQDPTAADIAGRIQSMFFLGTPHRGSANMARILEDMPIVTWRRKPFMTDLAPNSAILASINNDFRHFAPELRLWSFYETLPMRGAGHVRSRIVVERHSATMGYHNEEIAPMDADHRHVCKFDTPADPNYIMLRNALLTAIDLIRETTGIESVPPALPSEPPMPLSEARPLLRSFLGVRDSFEGDLATLQVLKQPGSCQWFTETSSFTSWRAGAAPPILWLVGKPGAGKSVLASHVIDQLNPPQSYCSYFICKDAKAGESTMSDCFRSIAFQMAMHDDQVRAALLQLAQDGLAWDKTDEAAVWRRLFTGCIFKLPSIRRHFWVIDALDESANFKSLFTKRLLASLPNELRLFATSRNLDEIERGLDSLGPSRANMQVLSDDDTLDDDTLDDDTLDDMHLFLTTRLTELERPERAEDRERMCEKILSKSCGSFLWTRLVLQEFEDTWTEEAMDAVLREIPVDLFSFYSRMVESIAADRRKMTLARSILIWVVLARRPLTVDELRCAVKLDINQTLQNAAKAIPGLCAQLIFIDQCDTVHLIHETAREFLLADGFGLELSIDEKHGHTRLASLLLGYLCSVLKPLQKAQQSISRPRGFAKPAITAPSVDTALLDYACSFFSDNLCRATSASDDLMDSLGSFLGTNSVLSWIEHIARGGELASLTQTAINLREYLGQRMKYVPPTDQSVQLVDGWITDLIRVAAKFRDQLLACPSSIHCLIPPLCPPDSVISRTFSNSHGRPSFTSSGLVVKGLPPGSWDDCLIWMDFHDGETTAVSHGDRYFAIGLCTGQISVYDLTSIQCLRQIEHPEWVEMLEFSPNSLLLASSGMTRLVVWDPKSGTMVHSFPLQSPLLAVTFLGVDELLGAFQSNELTKWCLETEEHETISWIDSGLDEETEVIIPRQPPNRVAFLATDDEVLLALGYRARPILIWNALELQLLGTCSTDSINNGIDDMVFNPNPETPVLLVAYQAGSLCVFDYRTMELQVERPHVYAECVAYSPDGRSIIIGSKEGIIEVFKLERAYNGTATTLTLIYRTNHLLGDTITGVAFSADGLRFVNVQDQQGRVWAPAALVRKSTSELESPVRTTSDGDPALLLPPRPRGVIGDYEVVEITSALVASADGSFIVAGKSNGDVVLFTTADARQTGILYRHDRGGRVVSIALAESQNQIISADTAGHVKVAMLEFNAANPSVARASVVLGHKFGAAVRSLLVNAAGDRLLVGGRHSVDQLWEIPSGTRILPERSSDLTSSAAATVLDPGPTILDRPPRSAVQHPSNPSWFVIISGGTARIYSWTDFAELTPLHGISLIRESQPPQASVTPSYHVGPGFVVELLRSTNTNPSPPHLYLWPSAVFDPSSPTTSAQPAVEPNLAAIAPTIFTILGTLGTSTVVLLDVNLWVCSVQLESLPPTNTASVGAPLRPGGTAGSFGTPLSLPYSRSGSSTSEPVIQPHQLQARRHFFALSEWRAASGDLLCTLVPAPAPLGRGGSGSRGVVAFACGDCVVVVHGGLEF